MKENKTPFVPKHYWICSDCAESFGGTWPEGHVATVIEDICKYCNFGIKQTVAPWIDYDWQKQKSLTKRAKAMRD